MSSVRVHQSKLISKCMIRSEAWSAKRVLTSARQNRHRHTGILASSIPAKHASDCMRWEQMLTLRVKQNNLLTFVVTVNYSLQKTRPLQFRWVEYLTSYYARRHVLVFQQTPKYESTRTPNRGHWRWYSQCIRRLQCFKCI